MGDSFYFQEPSDAVMFVDEVEPLFDRLTQEAESHGPQAGHLRIKNYQITTEWRGLALKKEGTYFVLPLI